jgi:hypothetical protein
VRAFKPGGQDFAGQGAPLPPEEARRRLNPAQAELISINIGSFGIGGINGGVSDNNIRDVTDFPISGGAETENSLSLYNNNHMKQIHGTYFK